MNLNGIPELKIYFPPKLVFGKNCFDQIPEELKRLGCKKLLVVTIEPLLPRIKNLEEELSRHSVSMMKDTNIVQEPSFADFKNLIKKVEAFSPDTVIGIGGGSVLDIAKLVAAQLDNEQELEEYVGIGLLKGRKKNLVCVPATSGTGSEVSPNAILVDEKDGQKKGIISPWLVPDSVFVDPLLTISVPPGITAATGIDALTHCLEAYTNKFAHPLIDTYAYEGMRLIAAHLERAVKNSGDEEARTAVAMGSLMGGFCLGPVNTAAVHALSYPLGSRFHLPHGLSNALLLPYVMEYNLETAPARYAQVAMALGCSPGKDDLATAKAGVSRIRELILACGLPLQLRDVGVKEEALPELASEAMKITRLLKNNPRELSEENALSIFRAAY